MEIWRPIIGLEGFYEVSDLGNVRSVARVAVYSDGRRRPVKQSVLRPWIDRHGYRCVTTKVSGDKRCIRIYKAVAAAFLGAKPAGLEVCHGAAGQLDDAVSNLRFDTHAANMADRDRDGTTARGERSGRAKLTDANVIDIRRRWPGESQHKLAAEYGVSHTSIWQVTSGRCWRHV